jgi:hypothetical protein
MRDSDISALRNNRRLIVAVSLAAGSFGLAPVPLVGDLAIGTMRALLIRWLARRHKTELSTRAIIIIAGDAENSLKRLAAAGSLTIGLRLAWRKLSRALLLLFRFDDMSRTFLLGTYFDYYCLTYHNEKTLDLEKAESLSQIIQDAGTLARQHLISALFQKVLDDLYRAGTFVPKKLWRLAFSLISDKEQQAEQVLDSDTSGFFSRITLLIEEELNRTEQVTVAALCEAFDRAWRKETGTAGV